MAQKSNVTMRRCALPSQQSQWHTHIWAYLWWSRYGAVCPRQMPRRGCLELRGSRDWL